VAKFAKARSDLALEKERLASSQEKTAKIDQMQADAEHKRVQADMELVKMIIELEDLDLANFRASFDMAEAIKMANREEELLNSSQSL